jgi:hypothetical protein
MTGPLAKAALVEYLPTWPPTPVVSVVQYNPEKMVHNWSQTEPPGQPGVESNNPLAVAGMPAETFQFTIYLNADDDLVSGIPVVKDAAQRSGVGARLAALEMLLYPEDGSPAAGRQPKSALLGTVSAGRGSPGVTWKLPNATVPVVLFYWNSHRVVPVRVTSLNITETLYDTDLNPVNASADLSLRVLTPAELEAASPEPGTPSDLARVAYNRTLSTRRQWAAKNTAAPVPVSIASKLSY